MAVVCLIERRSPPSCPEPPAISSGIALRAFFPAAEHSLVGFQELFPRTLPEGGRQFSWLVTATEFHRLTKALGKFDARRTSRNVSFYFLTGVGRKLQVQILGK